ncbi:MAG: hypothetical protein PHU07_11830 [Acidocella sp.]|nr:hypothetical protein [Acidocella sp.]
MPASLVDQLQNDAIQRSAPITDLLRKAKIVAIKLGNSNLSNWVDRELNGYFDVPIEQLPQYRQVRGEIKWLNPYQGWQSVGLDVTQPTPHPIGELLGLISNESGHVLASVPIEFANKVRRELGIQADVKFHTSCAALSGVIDGVRNAVLDWAIKLEQAGIHGNGLSFSQIESDRAQTVHINIGSIGNAVGLGAFGRNASVTSYYQADAMRLATESTKLAGQIESQLPHADLPPETIEQVQSALSELKAAASEATPHASRLTQALGALQRIMEGAASNLVATGVTSMIAKILSGQ